MNDLLLGVIIGGLIGLVGSAIQGCYSLKCRREENLSRERQQSTQIQHEKDSQVLSRRIALRSKYLEPLTNHLSALHTSFDEHRTELIDVIRIYHIAEDKMEVHKADKEEFGRKLDKIDGTFDAIEIPFDKTRNVISQVADGDLIRMYDGLLDAVLAFYKHHVEMYRSLGNNKEAQDFVYDFKEIMNSMSEVQLSISNMHKRIESLLAEVD